jgi:hypothetical protein
MKPDPEIDWDKVDETVLALLSLTFHDVDEFGARAWKSHDWSVMDRLHVKGYISDPKNKAKSVQLTPEAVEKARELFKRHFSKRAAQASTRETRVEISSRGTRDDQ